MNADIPYFYGEKVKTTVPITCPKWDEVTGWYRYPTDPEIIPPGIEGIFLKRVHRPVFGYVNMIRVKTEAWSGWCLLTDDEIEVLHG